MRLSLRLRIRATLRLKRPDESNPELRLYLSQTVSRDVIVVPLSADDSELADYELSVDVDPATVTRALETCCLNLDLYVQMLNDYAQVCSVPVGCAIAPLGMLYAKGSGGAVLDLYIPVLNYDRTGYLPKARCTVTLLAPATLTTTRTPIADCVGLQHISAAAAASSITTTVLSGDYLRAQGIKLQEHFDPPDPFAAYIRRAEQAYSPPAMPCKWNALNNVNIFTWRCRAGPLPAPAYPATEPSGTDEQFFLQAARIAMRRMGLSERELLALEWRSNAAHARLLTNWLATTLSLYAQYSFYISDFAVVPVRRGTGHDAHVEYERVDIDWFQYPCVRSNTGDCEDHSVQICILARDLLLLTPQSALVARLLEVRRGFVVAMLLDGVTSAAIDADQVKKSGAAAEQEQDAHMNVALLSLPLAAGLLREPTLGASQFANPLAPPITMLEGTGPLDPDGTRAEDPQVAPPRAALLDFRDLRTGVRQVYHYTCGKGSDFYQSVKVILTNDVPPHSRLFVLKYVQERCVGVRFADIADPRKLAQLEAVAETPLSDDDWRLVAYYRRNVHPLFPVVAASDDGAGAPEHVRRARRQMEEITREIQSRFGAVQGRDERRRRGFPLLVYYQSFDPYGQFRAKMLAALHRFCSALPHATLDDAVEERVAVDTGGFYLRLSWEK
jgi:hypothetical protein